MRLLTEVEPQQKDYLCGPFHAARVLLDCGVAEFEGEPVDQDLVALHAGTALPVGAVDEVPPGAASRHDYRYELPRVDREQAGTSAPGLAAAIERLCGGRLVCVPVSGRWTAAAVERLMELDARLLANLRTGLLWRSRPSQEALLAALDGVLVADPPPADWDVGHFVELVQLVRGRNGSLVLVRDSYPSLGWGGVHLQPPVAVAGALARDDGREGGVLAVVSPDGADAVGKLASELGLNAKMWEN
jgi:hypothetical protein